eukprot:gene10950-12948_t
MRHLKAGAGARQSVLGNLISDSGAEELAKGIEQNDSLEKLSLECERSHLWPTHAPATSATSATSGSRDPLTQRCSGGSGNMWMRECVGANHVKGVCVQRLDTGNNLSDRGAAALTSALETNTALVYLSFY